MVRMDKVLPRLVAGSRLSSERISAGCGDSKLMLGNLYRLLKKLRWPRREPRCDIIQIQGRRQGFKIPLFSQTVTNGQTE